MGVFRVLVVDSDAMVGNAFAEFLRASGFEVLTGSRLSFQELKEAAPDVLIIDIDKQSHAGLVQALLEETGRPVVIATTTGDDIDFPAAVIVLSKPFPLDPLVDYLELLRGWASHSQALAGREPEKRDDAPDGGGRE